MQRTERHGIGGWLLLFLLLIGLGAPLMALAGTMSVAFEPPSYAATSPESWRRVLVLEWMMLAVRVALCWYSVARLIFVRRWGSVRIAVSILWCALPLVLAAYAGLVVLLRWGSFGDTIGWLMLRESPVLWLATAIVWTAYFYRSKRVAHTYARPGFAAASVAETARVFD